MTSTLNIVTPAQGTAKYIRQSVEGRWIVTGPGISIPYAATDEREAILMARMLNEGYGRAKAEANDLQDRISERLAMVQSRSRH